MRATLTELLENPPSFHIHPATKRDVSWGVEPEALRYMASIIPPGGATLETGAGLSTVCFAMHGCRHITIAPDAALFDRIRTYCEAFGINLDQVTFVEAQSESCLPSMSLPSLDFVLVDGDHAFPIPFIDFFYAARVLKIGGSLAVDDTDILPCTILREFLREDRHWDRGRELGRMAFFTKLEDGTDSDGWERQAFLTGGWLLTKQPASAVNATARAWRLVDTGDFNAALASTTATERSLSSDISNSPLSDI